MHKKVDYFNFSPVIVLIWSVISFIFIPIIPVANGFGWDGIFYGKVALSFNDMIGNINSYHANRIFPGILIHYIFTIFRIPLTINSVLIGFRIYNIFIIVISSVIWVLILNKFKLSHYVKWIGFCALFINYPMMNLHYYYPPLTDGTAFFLGILMLYLFLIKSNILLLLVTMISYFSWPAGIIIGFLLYIYSDTDNIFWLSTKKNSFLFIFFILSPFLTMIAFNVGGEIIDILNFLGLDKLIFSKFSIPDFPKINYIFLINAILLGFFVLYIYWLVLKKFDFVKFIKYNFKKEILLKLLIVATILLILIFLKKIFYSPNLPTLKPLGYFYSYFVGSNVRFPLQFIVYHITYWGPSIILLILCFRDFISHLQKFSFPILAGFLFILLLSINSEARPIINFYPFIVLLILQSFDFSKINNRKLFVFLFFLVSFLYSKVWFFIKLPSSVFPESIWSDLDKFPMQAYFMNFGLFTNNLMYYIHAFIAIFCYTLFWFLFTKRGIYPKMKVVNTQKG